MEAPVDFKFDVRIRARMLTKKVVAESEITKHLEALPDLQGSSDVIAVPQPALVSPESRTLPRPVEPRAVIPASAPRSLPPPALPVDEGWGDEEEGGAVAAAGDKDDEGVDEDDDEDDEDGEKVEAKADDGIAGGEATGTDGGEEE